ncbi:MAG TPA: hypothetical protein VF060_05030 [Trebonia sp.]
MLAITCAPGGIGKLPIGAFTWTVATGLADADGDGECDGDGVGEDPARLEVCEGDSDGWAVVIPAEHAARDRPTAQVSMDITVLRYVSIYRPFSQLIAAGSKLCGRCAVGIAALSRVWDSEARFRYGPAPEGGC